MTLKRKIDQETFDELSKDLQAEYTKDGEEYILDAEDDGNSKTTAKERRAFDRTKQELKDTKAQLKELSEKLAELEENDNDPENKRKTKDIETLTRAHEERVAEIEAKVEKANKVTAEKMIDAAANEMATAISTKPKYIIRDIRDRLTVEFDDDGEPTLIVKSSKGKNSEMTLEQLRKEFVANKDYADIIIGSKASGGNAPRKATDQKPGNAGASETEVDLSKLSGKALAQHIKDRKEAEAQ